MNADELDAAREAVAASRAWRDQMRADWGYHREPEEVLDEAVGELTAGRDRLQTVVDAVMAALGEHAPANVDQLGDYVTGFVIEWDLLHRERDRLRAVVEQSALQSFSDEDQWRELVAERDRLQAVVGAARRWRTARPGDESSDAVQAMEAALAQLDASPGRGGHVNDDLYVETLIAERDRLTDELVHIGFAVIPEGTTGVVRENEILPMVKATVAERDGLRAVVRRAQEAWALHVADDPDEYDGTSPALIEWMAAWEALRALDVGPTGENT